jgi:hypothetical protein
MAPARVATQVILDRDFKTIQIQDPNIIRFDGSNKPEDREGFLNTTKSIRRVLQVKSIRSEIQSGGWNTADLIILHDDGDWKTLPFSEQPDDPADANTAIFTFFVLAEIGDISALRPAAYATSDHVNHTKPSHGMCSRGG